MRLRPTGMRSGDRVRVMPFRRHPRVRSTDGSPKGLPSSAAGDAVLRLTDRQGLSTQGWLTTGIRKPSGSYSDRRQRAVGGISSRGRIRGVTGDGVPPRPGFADD